MILPFAAAGMALFAGPAPGTAQEEEDWNKIELRITKVGGSVYMIDKVEAVEGFDGGNVGASVGSDGIVLVDDKFAPLAPKILAALKTVSDQPVRFVINTHVHGDHTGGNVAFGPTATIIAHANTRQQLSSQGPRPEDKPEPAAAWPIITLDDGLMLYQNGEDIRIFHVPHAHTDTDVVVFFRQSNVVHMGDLYFSGMFPFIGQGGTVAGIIAGISRVLNEIPADAKVIPGHGPLSSTAELRSTLVMLKETTTIVESGIKEKKSVEQMKQEKVLAAYEKWGAGFLGTDQYLEQLYRVLTR